MSTPITNPYSIRKAYDSMTTKRGRAFKKEIRQELNLKWGSQWESLLTGATAPSIEKYDTIEGIAQKYGFSKGSVWEGGGYELKSKVKS